MTRRILAILFLLFLAVAPAAGAEKEKPLPKDLPSYGELKPFQAPQVTTAEACQWTDAVAGAAPGLSQSFLYAGRAGRHGR